MDKNLTAQPENKAESNERKLADLFSKLPKQLQDLWREKTEAMGLEDEEAIKVIEDVLRQRAEVKERIFTRIHEIESPELKEEVRGVVHAVENTFGDMNYFVGNGSVAEVYETPYSKRVCVKYLVNVEMAKEHGNNFQEEVGYLEDM